MFKEKSNNFIPKDRLVTFAQIVSLCKERGIDITIRAIRFYITEGLLPKPMYIRKVAYYDRDFIIDELDAIYVLRSLFNKGIEKISVLAKHPWGSLKDMVSELHDALTNKVSKFFPKHKNRPLGLQYANNKFMQYFAEEYFKKIEQGHPPAKMNNDKFVSEVFDKYDK